MHSHIDSRNTDQNVNYDQNYQNDVIMWTTDLLLFLLQV